jgi:chemotaxis protein CheZ
MEWNEEESRLKRELVRLFGHLNQLRRELASLESGYPQSFSAMADALDAIVENTETASNAILESMEAIDGMVGELRATGDAAVLPICDRITDRVNQVFEACSFQDLTGQRITRLVNGLKFVEERVNAMVRVWGREELSKVMEELKQESLAHVDPDKALIHGPQRPAVAISQGEVDKLFSQDDIDKLFG